MAAGTTYLSRLRAGSSGADQSKLSSSTAFKRTHKSSVSILGRTTSVSLGGGGAVSSRVNSSSDHQIRPCHTCFSAYQLRFFFHLGSRGEGDEGVGGH